MDNKIEAQGEVVNISSKNGYSQIAIKVDVESKYDTFLAFDFKDEDMTGITQGDKIKCIGYAVSREWKGKYYTGIRGFKIQKAGGTENNSEPTSKPKTETEEFDDIPF